MSKQFKLHIPISKVDEEQRMVYGVATTEAIDSQNDIVDYEASKAAFPAWLGNIREMHQPIAVGKAIDIQFDDDAKQVIIGAKISESVDGENAWTKVKEGILQGFSIGGSVSKVKKETAKVDGNEIDVTRIMEYSLSEVSLVDNPANPEAMLVMVKSQKGGLQRVEENFVGAEVEKNFRMPAWHLQFMTPFSKGIELLDGDLSKRDYSQEERDAMAQNGQALPDGSYPIKTVSDLKNALQSFGRAKDKDKVKKHIISRAKSLGRTDLLPEEWNVKATITADLKKSVMDASWLAGIATGLVCYIKEETEEGDPSENMDGLHNALTLIQQAIAQEVLEGDDFEPSDELYDAVYLAQSVTNLEKGKDVEKSVVGAEDRDENAVVTATQEDNGRPVDDTHERANTAAEDEAEAEVEEPAAVEEKVETKVEVKTEDGAESGDAAEAAEDEGKADEAEESEKSVTLGDLRKFTDSLLSKLGDNNKADLQKALGEVVDKVEKSMASLEDRIKSLEDQPAAPKAKASYVEIEKGNEGSSSEEADVQALLKRRDELAANPNEGTPQERMALAQQLRKAQAAGHKIA